METLWCGPVVLNARGGYIPPHDGPRTGWLFGEPPETAFVSRPKARLQGGRSDLRRLCRRLSGGAGRGGPGPVRGAADRAGPGGLCLAARGGAGAGGIRQSGVRRIEKHVRAAEPQLEDLSGPPRLYRQATGPADGFGRAARV